MIPCFPSHHPQALTLAITLYQRTVPNSACDVTNILSWALTKHSRKIDTPAGSGLVIAQGKSAHLPGPSH